MQSGFGLLEAGYASRRCEVSIMMKNAVDVVVGGVSFWMVGYGLEFGEPSNAFCGFGAFFTNGSDDLLESGWLYARYIFQFSFAAAATTIVSGCVAERCKFSAYMAFAFINSIIFSVAGHWVWTEGGWLRKLGHHDFAGDGPVHILGACNGAVATYLLGPRRGVEPKTMSVPHISSGSSVIFGLFVLWWGWIGFNCGSTFGLSGARWSVAARIAAATVNSSCWGGVAALIYSGISTGGQYRVDHLCSGVLGGLVAIAAPCAVVSPRDANLIGFLGGLIAIQSNRLVARLGLDDPIGAIGVHGFAGAWGLISVAFFARDTLPGIEVEKGVLYGGEGYFLGVQCLGVLSITLWAVVSSYTSFKFIGLCLKGLRLSPEDEDLGSDVVDHGYGQTERRQAQTTVVPDPNAYHEAMTKSNSIGSNGGMFRRLRSLSRLAGRGEAAHTKASLRAITPTSIAEDGDRREAVDVESEEIRNYYSRGNSMASDEYASMSASSISAPYPGSVASSTGLDFIEYRRNSNNSMSSLFSRRDDPPREMVEETFPEEAA